MQLISFDSSTGVEVRFGFEPVRLVSGGPVRWVFTLVNRGRERRVVTFTSSQRGEVVLAAGGSERYRWSRGRLFAAVLGEQALAPGQEWSYPLVDSLALPAGQYVLHATVPAQPALPPVHGEVMIYP